MLMCVCIYVCMCEFIFLWAMQQKAEKMTIIDRKQEIDLLKCFQPQKIKEKTLPNQCKQK